MNHLIALDREAFLFLNGGHSEILDFLMFWITNRYTWFPFYTVLILLIIRSFRWRSSLILIGAGLLILAVDQSIASLIKPFFERQRPCFDPTLAEQVHLVTHCGGPFGFFSAHAANTFAIATYLYLWFKSRPTGWMFAWAALVSYSRIYVGVHFPLDVLAGALYGVLLGAAAYKIATLSDHKILRLL